MLFRVLMTIFMASCNGHRRKREIPKAWNSTATATALQQREPAAFNMSSDKTSLQRSARTAARKTQTSEDNYCQRLLPGSIFSKLVKLHAYF